MNANEAMAQHFVTQFLAPWSQLHLLRLLYFLLSSPFALGRFFRPVKWSATNGHFYASVGLKTTA